MNKTSESAPSLRLLHKSVDELATRALLGEDPAKPGGDGLRALVSLAQDARKAGLEEVASIAEELALALAGPQSGNSMTLLDGIGRIQNILEQHPAGAWPNPASDAGALSNQACVVTLEAGVALEAGANPEAGVDAGVDAGAHAGGQAGLHVDEPLDWAADPELLSEFFMESGDHLTSIESELLKLEQNAANMDAVHSIFRSFHTIKGLAGFMGFQAVQEVAHEVETLLDAVRQGVLKITPEVIDIVLGSADHLKRELDGHQSMAAGGPAVVAADHRPLLEAVRTARGVKAPPAAASLAPVTRPAAPASALVPARAAAPTGLAVNSSAAVAAPVTEAAAAELARTEGKGGGTPESRVVKVDTSKLDFLVDMAGELAIAQSMIQHDGQLHAAANPRLQRNLAHLARITEEVQKTTMAMRMVPVGQLFQKSMRLVRDLTRKSGKKAELIFSGEDTELDRTIVEQLADPLMHMIRNAADHGIETPEERAAAGKDPVARIQLKAYHQAGCIVVEVTDDGRGLNVQKILNKAVERGLIQEGATLTEKEIFNLIFEPGFSTAAVITDVSGRGVGMDVVRKQMQKLRGRIDIESHPGKGSTFFLKLPLTLAIIDGLAVKVGEQRYILPIYVVREIFRPKADARFTLEDRDEMVLVRGNLLPVTRLYQRFGVHPRTTQLSEGVLVVVETAIKSFCLLVDEVIGKQEVVIKSLGDMFKGLAGVAGGAILGDGRVGLILDMDTLLGEPSGA